MAKLFTSKYIGYGYCEVQHLNIFYDVQQLNTKDSSLYVEPLNTYYDVPPLNTKQLGKLCSATNAY